MCIQKHMHHVQSDGCPPPPLVALSKNNIDTISFTRQVVKTLTKGRGKGSKYFINRPANCVKSFMLMPLSITFDYFFCPSNFKFNFVGAIDKEIIFFNELRYGPNSKRYHGINGIYHGINS